MSNGYLRDTAMPTRRTVLKLGAFGALAVVATPALTACGSDGDKTTLTVAGISVPVAETLAKFTKSHFEVDNPDIRVNFVTLTEAELLAQVTRDVSTRSGRFDILMSGPDGIEQYKKNNWIESLDPFIAMEPNYNIDDIIPTVRSYFSPGGEYSGAPLYSESAFTMYRKDTFDEAGLSMPERPTWDDIRDLAAALHQPGTMAGLVIPGAPVELVPTLAAMMYTYGGRFFTPDFEPTFTEERTVKAIETYVDLARNFGQPSVANAGFTDCLATMSGGKGAMWVGATVAASTLEDASQSKVVRKLGYAYAPTEVSSFGGWFWGWALGLSTVSEHKDAAWKFISWATSADYVNLIGETNGWATVPPGTRESTYANPEYQKAAAYADVTLKSIEAGNNPDAMVSQTAPPNRPVGYMLFPEWNDLAQQISTPISEAISGQKSVDQAIAQAQESAVSMMTRLGYVK